MQFVQRSGCPSSSLKKSHQWPHYQQYDLAVVDCYSGHHSYPSRHCPLSRRRPYQRARGLQCRHCHSHCSTRTGPSHHCLCLTCWRSHVINVTLVINPGHCGSVWRNPKQVTDGRWQVVRMRLASYLTIRLADRCGGRSCDTSTHTRHTQTRRETQAHQRRTSTVCKLTDMRFVETTLCSKRVHSKAVLLNRSN